MIKLNIKKIYFQITQRIKVQLHSIYNIMFKFKIYHMPCKIIINDKDVYHFCSCGYNLSQDDLREFSKIFNKTDIPKILKNIKIF